jgi:hypothetical protein
MKCKQDFIAVRFITPLFSGWKSWQSCVYFAFISVIVLWEVYREQFGAISARTHLIGSTNV